ncbi:type IV pilus modification PilV family protein [Paenibacillus dakarensis]|uniref:type IV pilus modification PilV family protein n=1 Tax=Paenibacillus dakarensis TaxID=1527293 RepID=UPI0006D537A1|nr:type II secretion system protein [Paenibacillus dakarensis]
MKKGFREEHGFTLLEVLAAIIILSIVSLVLTSYFTNAMSYSKSNQNKTVMANLARNALFYMEKQDFKKMKELFDADKSQQPDLAGSLCKDVTGCLYKDKFLNPDVLPEILNPVINDVQYELEIVYQADLHQTMLAGGDPADGSPGADGEKRQMAQYLLPVKVVVKGPGGARGQAHETVVEGYITDEKIR